MIRVPSVREAAVETMKELNDTRAVEPLIQALKDEDSSVREGAAWALGSLGDTRAVDPLILALKDEDSQVRDNAAWALKYLGWQPGFAQGPKEPSPEGKPVDAGI